MDLLTGSSADFLGIGALHWVPQISIGDAETTEPAPGAPSVKMTFEVMLDAPADEDVTVEYMTVDDTATAGEDYEEASDTVTIPSGEMSATIEILINGDMEMEDDETFTIELSEPENAELDEEHSVGTGTILDASMQEDQNSAPPVDDPCGCALTPNVSGNTGNLSFGEMVAAGALADSAMLNYQSGQNPHPIVSVDAQVPDMPGSMLLYSADATLTFGTETLPTIYYEDATGLAEGSDLQFSTLVDATGMASGTYNWSLQVNYHFDVEPEDPSSPQSKTVTYRGQQSIMNRSDSPYGEGWWISGAERLALQPSQAAAKPEGLTHLTGDGVAGFYPYNESVGEYESPYGHREELTIEDEVTTLTDRFGNKKRFEAFVVEDNVLNLLMTSVVDTNGNVTNYAYNPNGSLASITDAFGHSITFAYSGGKLSSITDAAGRVTTLTIDANNKLTSIDSPPLVVGGEAVTTALTYDGATSLLSNLTRTTSAVTQSTDYHFDEITRRLTHYEHEDETEYSVIAAAVTGLVDLAGGLGTELNPAAFVADDLRTSTITDELGNVASETFNGKGQVVSRTDFSGNTTTFEYDERGNVVTMIQADPDGAGPLDDAVTAYEYDERDNLVSIEYPDGSVELWLYSSTWNVPVLYFDGLALTVYTLDQQNGNVLSVNHNSRVTSYSYTPEPTQAGDLPGGLVLTETDPLGRVTKYEYDDTPGESFGKVTSITYAFGTTDEGTVHYEYDAAGNTSAQVDELGRRTEYLYNARNELIQITEPQPDGSTSSPVTMLEYDGYGRLRATIDPLGGETNYFYDDRGRLLQVIEPDPDAGSPTGPTTTYEYDAAGNLIKLIDPLGRVTRFEYDPMGRRTKTIAPDPEVDGPTTLYTYDGWGNVASMTDPNGNETRYEYDIMGRLIKTILPDPDGAGPLESSEWAYEYDSVGAICGSWPTRWVTLLSTATMRSVD